MIDRGTTDSGTTDRGTTDRSVASGAVTDSGTLRRPRSSVRWEAVSDSHWTAFRGARWVGSVALTTSFIATDQDGTVLGSFERLADAQRAITDPEVVDADLARRLHARRLHRQDRLRLVAVGVLAAAALVVTALAYLLLTHVGV